MIVTLSKSRTGMWRERQSMVTTSNQPISEGIINLIRGFPLGSSQESQNLRNKRRHKKAFPFVHCARCLHSLHSSSGASAMQCTHRCCRLVRRESMGRVPGGLDSQGGLEKWLWLKDLHGRNEHASKGRTWRAESKRGGKCTTRNKCYTNRVNEPITIH